MYYKMMKINGKKLKKWGLPQGPIIGEAIKVLGDKSIDEKEAKDIILNIVNDHMSYIDNEVWGSIARCLIVPEKKEINLVDSCGVTYFGKEIIEQGAIDQINIASRLPVSVKAAVMPDAHKGYGLPIGGVLAARNVVIPYAVGVDIGCRMHLTVTDMPFKKVEGFRDKLRNVLVSNTSFGAGQTIKSSHSILDDGTLDFDPIKSLKGTAIQQLGTSGGGNHFVNFGSMEWDGELKLAILSHSGSRGLGAKIANHYTKVAMDVCELPKEAKHLAWLSLDEDNGKEYWEAMNIAGKYAQSCHEVIHNKIINALKLDVLESIQNHHNFAWKESINVNGVQEELIVHRKGATPAGIGVKGIIPGSMTSSCFVVEGLGNEGSINSSSHGAGRKMSRTKAKENYSKAEMKKDLERAGVELIGGGVDESSFAYKNIKEVIEKQKDLVKIIGEFKPWMVRMASD